MPGLRVVVHHGSSRSSAAELASRDRRRRRRDHHLRHRGSRRRSARGRHVGTDRARRGAGHQEPGERDQPAAPADPGPDAPRAHRHADRERARRPVGDPRFHEPRPRRVASGVHRPDVGRRRSRPAGVERHLAVPPHEERAGGRGGASRQDRRARSLHDDGRADRPLPGGARRARRQRRRSRRRRRTQAGSDPRRHHRAQADLQPPGRVPGRRAAARRSLRQAVPSRGDRRVRLRRRRADPRVHPLRDVGPPPGRPSHRGDGPPDRLLRRQPRQRRPRPPRSPSSRTARARVRWCCR